MTFGMRVAVAPVRSADRWRPVELITKSPMQCLPLLVIEPRQVPVRQHVGGGTEPRVEQELRDVLV